MTTASAEPLHRWAPAVPLTIALAMWAAFVVLWNLNQPMAALIFGLLLLPVCGLLSLHAHAAITERDRPRAASAVFVASILGNPITVLLITLAVTGYRF